MNKTSAAKFFHSVRATLAKRSPEILTGIGIAGMVSTTILAVRATPKAMRLIEEKKAEESTATLTKKEVVKTCWKCYIPAAVTGVTSVTCLVGASSVHLKRNTALATAYKLSETALTEYRDKVVETIGEKKEQTVRDKIAKDHIDRDPVGKNNEVIVTERGKTLCYDYLSGRYFTSDIDLIKKAENKLNKQMIHDIGGYVSLNDFYDEINLDHIELGYDLGWNVEKGLININFSSQLAKDGTPCLVLDHVTRPQYGFC